MQCPPLPKPSSSSSPLKLQAKNKCISSLKHLLTCGRRDLAVSAPRAGADALWSLGALGAPQGRDGALLTSVPFQTLFLALPMVVIPSSELVHRLALGAPQGRDGALLTSVPFQTLFLALPMVVIPSSELVHRLALWAPGHSPGPQEASTLTVHSASLLWGADGTKL